MPLLNVFRFNEQTEQISPAILPLFRHVTEKNSRCVDDMSSTSPAQQSHGVSTPSNDLIAGLRIASQFRATSENFEANGLRSKSSSSNRLSRAGSLDFPALRDATPVLSQRYQLVTEAHRVSAEGTARETFDRNTLLENTVRSNNQRAVRPHVRTRSRFKDLLVQRLPELPPTLHVHSSRLPPNPGSPWISQVLLSSEKPAISAGSMPNSTTVHLADPASENMMRKMLRWEIWLFRIALGIIIAALNLSLLMIYLFTDSHHYVLALLVFMKSKDLISAIIGLVGIVWSTIYDRIWYPKEVDSKWIMSLVCAYAESETQIMKTVSSLLHQELGQHKQIICIILDGKPRDILSHFTRITYFAKKPYKTWKGVQGELQIHAGRINPTPVLLMQKAKNAGKKDTLILGHSLFNFPRNDAAVELNVLRRDIFTYVLPDLTGVEGFRTFDFVYATDADSIIHQRCLKELADALSRNSKAIAACGIVLAELDQSEWSAWHLFQQFQYTFGQLIRRQAEHVWGRITCLPGPVTMVAVRCEMGKAISDYAAPVMDANLFRHQVQYQGTDRRLTFCMLSQNKELQTILVTKAYGETVVPTTLKHYLSQRRRWAANAYFNNYMYAFGAKQRLITRVLAIIDIVRMSFIYYRVANTILFVRSLAHQFYLLKIIPTLILTKGPLLWFILLILLREPILRYRLHMISCGIILNQFMSPFLSIIIFSRVLLNMGNHTWGITGVGSNAKSIQKMPLMSNVTTNCRNTQGALLR